MTDDKILEAVKKFLVENVASNFKLEKPTDDGKLDEKYELVSPAVYIGWIPPKNYLTEYGYDLPALLVMEDSGEDDGEEANITIRIAVATYDPGLTHSQNLESNITDLNFKGYKDLLNVIQRTRVELSKVSTFGGEGSLNKSKDNPIKWAMYEEQQYPYWHGWISFKISTMPLNYQNSEVEKYL